MFELSENIKIDSIFAVDKLLDFNINATLNNHIVFKYRGLVDNERFVKLSSMLNNKETVSVSSEKHGKLFVGYPLNIELSEENEINYLSVTCISYSYLLDIKGKSRSFQNIDETYLDILKKVYADNDDAYILSRDFKNREINRPIFKYKETDWQFTLRMAAHLCTVVYTNIIGEYPQVYIGVKQINTEITDYINIKEGYDKEKYLEHKSKDLKPDYSDYYFATFIYDKNFDLGELVIFKNQRLTVVKKYIYMENDSIYIKYTLSSIKPYIIWGKYNENIEGLALRGTTIATSGELVKVHFDIDQKQSEREAFWFDYKPLVGNVMHTMPQIGTTVMAKFNGCEDYSLRVVNVIHENAPVVSDLLDYNKRYYTTEFRKRLAMIPDSLYFSTDDDQVYLNDKNGIIANTNHNFVMTSMENIEIRSNSKTLIHTPEHIYITKPGSKSVIDMAGHEINAESPNTLISSDPNAKTLPYPNQDSAPPMSVGAGLAAIIVGTIPSVSRVNK